MSAPSPRQNDLLLGHEAAEAAVLEAWRSGRMHHAWLIAGPEGVGKATLAFRLARRLLKGGAQDSLALPPSDPVFRRVASGTHADLLVVEREWDDKKKRMRKSIAVDDARLIPPFLHLTPAEGGWRVVIVDGAEDLNPNSANALLKVLEEPPPRALLMLVCAAPGRLLPTLRSRCRRLALGPVPDAAVDALLRRDLPELGEGERATLVRLSGGSPGHAMRLADEEGLAMAGLVGELLGALPSLPLTRAYAAADRIGRSDTAYDLFMDLLRGAISGAVRAALRGEADAVQARLAALRPAAAWGELWEALTRLQADTDRLNLDKRQAVVEGVALLAGAR